MSEYDRLWPTMSDYDRIWPTMADYDRLCSTMLVQNHLLLKQNVFGGAVAEPSKVHVASVSLLVFPSASSAPSVTVHNYDAIFTILDGSLARVAHAMPFEAQVTLSVLPSPSSALSVTVHGYDAILAILNGSSTSVGDA